jgi:putative oxidoreductase
VLFFAQPPGRGGTNDGQGSNGDGHETRTAQRYDRARCASVYVVTFVLYGYFKLTGFAGTVVYMGRQGLPAPTVFAALAVIIELGGGLLILFGYQTRLVALGCAIYVLIAALIAHRNFGDGNQLSHFMKNMAIVGGFLAIMALGPGPYSVDGRKT